jgi:hypothetical protein
LEREKRLGKKTEMVIDTSHSHHCKGLPIAV